MSQKRWQINRRTALKGMGASMALPFLNAMVPSRALGATPAAKPPVRMAVLYMPNGVRESEWNPTYEGELKELTPILKPLDGLQKDISVLSNLQNAGSYPGDGHYVKGSGFLTGTTITKTEGKDISSNGVSMDQVCAREIGSSTPLPSLELGTEPVHGGVDSIVGYTRIYGCHIAWRTPTSPLSKEINPRMVYERLFGSGGSAMSAKQQKPLLDLVMDDAKRLEKRLGVEDRRKLEEYLDSVRSVESRLEQASKPKTERWKPVSEVKAVAPAPGVPESHHEHVRLMMDLMVLAFQTDSTRICTFMFGNEVSGKNFSFLDGVEGGHHSISHHEKKEEKLAMYQKINTWHMEQYAYMLNKLKGISEGESNLLDNSMVMIGSGIRDGNKHDARNLPIVLGGHGGGKIKAGKHLVMPKDTPLTNLYVTMLDAMGTPVERFSDSTGPLKQLT